MSILPTKLFSIDKTDYITCTELAYHFRIEPRQLNQILTNMGWIKKKHFIWWIATELGKKNGAKEYVANYSNLSYVYWHKDIMQNEELLYTIEKTVRSYIENSLYEEFIKEYYTQQEYTVWHYAKDKKHCDKNKNITLVAKKNREIILIHCRDNQLDISVDELKSFQKQRDEFKVANPVFANYDLKLHYCMSGFFMTEEAFEYAEDFQDNISYEVIKGDSSSTWIDSLLLDNQKA